MNPTDLVRGTAISLRQAVDMHTPKAIELWLDVVDEPAERAHQVTGLSAKECGRLGEQLDTTSAVELFDSIDSDLAAKVLDSQPNSRSAELLAGLDADRAADIARRSSPPCRWTTQRYCARCFPGPTMPSRRT
jgi:magnesium transporter